MAVNITSASAVRTILGVSRKELEDERLLEPIYSTLVSLDLDEISPQLMGDFVLAAAAVENESHTPAQAKFVDLTQTYTAYIVARHCLGSIKMFAPLTIKDSRTEVTRVEDPYVDLRGNIEASILYLRQRMLAVYGIINVGLVRPTRVGRRLVGIAPLGLNPVTG